MTENKFKRSIAYKQRIGNLSLGKPIFEEDKFKFLELGDKKISRVNIIANIVDKYESEGNTKYCFLTIDDGSGQIKLKAFGDDTAIMESANQGQTVVIIGKLRHFNNEIYIQPEIMKEMSPEYLLVRKLEVEKQKSAETIAPEAKEEIMAIKDKLLERIKQSEADGGIEIDTMILELKDISPEIINQEIKKMLEEGIIFEPRPGKVRYLG